MRQVVLISSSLVALLTICTFVFLNFSNSEDSLAATNGEYRSKANGNWNSTATWEKFNGTSWVAATATPTYADGPITIKNNVTVTAGVSVDEVTVNSNAQLTLNNGTFSVKRGTGNDLTVNGTLTIASTLTLKTQGHIEVNGLAIISTGGTLTLQGNSTIDINEGGRYRKDNGSQTNTQGAWTIKAGGTYQHNDNGTSLPNATWDQGSTCEITGATNNKPSNLNQSFYDFIWNCTGQTTNINLSSSNLNLIAGDFTCISTGTGSIMLNQGANTNYSFEGNFNMQGGNFFITESGGCSVNIGGNYTQTGGNFRMIDASSSSGSGTPDMTVTGNYSITGGTFDMSQYTGLNANNGKGTLNLNGDFSFTGGTITESSTLFGKGIINFIKNGMQTLTGGGTISNTIDYNITSGSIVNFGTIPLTGTGTFTLNSGGGVLLGSTAGISSLGLTGNVQVTGTKTFSTGADYTYNGSSAQVTGSALPATVRNLSINNNSGVTLTSTVAVSNVLALTLGKLSTGLFEVDVTNNSSLSVTGYSSSSYVNGALRRSVSGTGTYAFPLGNSANYEPSSLTLAGATGFTNIYGKFTQALPIVASLPLVSLLLGITPITDMLNYGYWTFTPNSAMTGGTYSVTLNEKGATNANSNPQSFCVLKRSSVLASWQSIGIHNNNTQSIAAGVITAVRTGLTGFSDFGIGESSGGSLPIKLIYFTAKLNSDIVNLDWATAAEVNNNFFTIERSADGEHFESLFTKPGAGNSTTNLYYSASDENPLQGFSFYRLKQTDYDGHYSFSDKQTVKNGNGNNASESSIQIKSVYPNPFNESFKTDYMVRESVLMDFSLLNSSGQVVAQEKIQADEGYNTYEFINNRNLNKGIYFVVLSYNDQKQIQKIIKN